MLQGHQALDPTSSFSVVRSRAGVERELRRNVPSVAVTAAVTAVTVTRHRQSVRHRNTRSGNSNNKQIICVRCLDLRR